MKHVTKLSLQILIRPNPAGPPLSDVDPLNDGPYYISSTWLLRPLSLDHRQLFPGKYYTVQLPDAHEGYAWS